MLYIRWTGHGIFSPLIIGIGVFGVTSITKALYGPSFIAGHPSVFWLGLALGGFLCWWTGVSANSDEPQEFVDQRTGRRLVRRKSHTLYGLPMQWWGVAAMAGGLFLAVTRSPAPAQFSNLASASRSPAAQPASNLIRNPSVTPVTKPSVAPPTNPLPATAVAPESPSVTEDASEQLAIRLYPALGVAGSPFNSKFLKLRKKYAAERPDYFLNPDWPVRLAREVAESP